MDVPDRMQLKLVGQPQRAVDGKGQIALITVSVENAPTHERLWIEDIYQNIFCGTTQGTRKQADGIVAVWRKVFSPPPRSRPIR